MTARVGVRLRQAVLAAEDLAAVSARLCEELELGEPFDDPEVAEFGLRNAVFAIGDGFLEVVSPAVPESAAGRYLRRHGGDGGYMVLFQFDAVRPARARLADLGVRTTWETDRPEILETHLHPSDMGGAIVSLAQAEPPQTWRPGGPDWTGRVGLGAPGRLAGVTVSVPDPIAVAARWGAVLGVPPAGARLGLDRTSVSFLVAGDRAGLTEIALELPSHIRRARDRVHIAGVKFTLTDLQEDQ